MTLRDKGKTMWSQPRPGGHTKCHGGRQKGTLQLYDPYASLGSYTVTLHAIDDAHSYK